MQDDREVVAAALAGEYDLVEELGRGGMALVFRARERELDRDVAVKVLPFALAFDAEYVERFQREARTAAQLEHPNIIPVYRVGRSAQVAYFVMKYLRGGSLAGLLAQRGRLNAPEIRRLLADCAAALAYAHQRGIVHRDIKPDNIMFDEFGQVHVTDFGIAKAVSAGRLTGTGMSIGTPHYMSPEQARAQSIDGRSDIYSLGVVAYQCLTGQVPFDGEDSYAIGYQHLNEPLPVPQLHNPDDRKLYETIRRMTMKDVEDRPQDCAELIRLLQHQPVAAPGSLASGTSEPAAPLLVTPTRSRPGTPPATPTRRLATPRSGSRQLPATPAPPERRAGGAIVAILLLLGLGAGGGWWYAQGAAATRAAGSGAPVDALGVPEPAPVAPPAVESGPVVLATPGPDSMSPPPPVESLPALVVPAQPMAQGVMNGDGVPEAPRDSGSLKIVGIPAGSSVLLDGEPVRSTVTRLAAGRHVVAISAPLHDFYEEQVEIVADDFYELQPVLVRQGAGTSQAARRAIRQRRLAARGVVPSSCDEPGPTYNADHSCYDVRPRPVVAARVPLPPEFRGNPSPSTVLVKVSPEGRVLVVKGLRSSQDLAFEQLAREYAARAEWKPARRDSQPVMGWTAWTIVGVRSPGPASDATSGADAAGR